MSSSRAAWSPEHRAPNLGRPQKVVHGVALAINPLASSHDFRDRSRSPVHYDANQYPSSSSSSYETTNGEWIPAARRENGRQGPLTVPYAHPATSSSNLYPYNPVQRTPSPQIIHEDLTKVVVESAHIDSPLDAIPSEGSGRLFSELKRGFRHFAGVFGKKPRNRTSLSCKSKRARRRVLPHQDPSKVFRDECMKNRVDEVDAAFVEDDDELLQTAACQKTCNQDFPAESPLKDRRFSNELRFILHDNSPQASSPRIQTPANSLERPATPIAPVFRPPVVIAAKASNEMHETTLPFPHDVVAPNFLRLQSRESIETDAFYSVLAKHLKKTEECIVPEKHKNVKFILKKSSELMKDGQARILQKGDIPTDFSMEKLELELKRLQAERSALSRALPSSDLAPFSPIMKEPRHSTQQTCWIEAFWIQKVVQHSYVLVLRELEKEELKIAAQRDALDFARNDKVVMLDTERLPLTRIL